MFLSLPALDKLAAIGKLKAEPRNHAEVGRLLAMAADPPRHNAAHAASLAALRWHGYRSESRFMVFQCLSHTVNWQPARWRVLDAAHRKRNLAEYEGVLDVEESVIKELCILTAELIADVSKLVRAPKPTP